MWPARGIPAHGPGYSNLQGSSEAMSMEASQFAAAENSPRVLTRREFAVFSPASSKSFFVRPPALCVHKSTVTLFQEFDQSG